MKRFPSIVTSVAALALGTGGVAHAQDSIPLLPRGLLFGHPDRAAPRISPDGTQLSFLAPVNGVLNIWVGSINDPYQAVPVTELKEHGIRSYTWAYTNEHILYLHDTQGGTDWQIFSIDLVTGDAIPLTPATAVAPGADQPHPVKALLQHVSPIHPTEIVVGLNDRDSRYHDLYRVTLDTGELIGVQFNEGFDAFYTDDAFTVRFASRSTPGGGKVYLQRRESEEGDESWEPFAELSLTEARSAGIVDFDREGEVVYMIDSRSRDTAALKEINLESGKTKILASDRNADISGGVLIHPTEKRVQAVSATYERKEWEVLDKSLRRDFKYLKKFVDGEMSIISRSLDDQHWIVGYDRSNGPAEYYHYVREKREASLLFTNRSYLEDLPLARMYSETIKSRDKRRLVTYYSLPVESDAKHKGRPKTPQPMVLWVHGGPWARDHWGWDPVHQWLANRGYAVMSVNYRGSTGFGKKFLNAGNHEWGGKMHADLVDAVEWAIKKKIADPQRIAIMGGSYGGYATLVGLIESPDLFRCGVDIVGPSNLVSFIEAIPNDWTALTELWSSRVGDPQTEQGRAMLAERSPSNHLERLTRPLLIGQGARDRRVPQRESEQIVQALEGAGIPVTFVVYPDEGHGLRRHANRLSFYAVTESFLANHLGGQAQPVGEAFARSSITIPYGAREVASADGPTNN